MGGRDFLESTLQNMDVGSTNPNASNPQQHFIRVRSGRRRDLFDCENIIPSPNELSQAIHLARYYPRQKAVSSGFYLKNG